MDTAEDLRREVRRLLQEAQGFIDPEVKRELAARVFAPAQRAEILERDNATAAKPVGAPLGARTIRRAAAWAR